MADAHISPGSAREWGAFQVHASQFLQWDAEAGAALFGDRVAEKICDKVLTLNLELRGFLARPLYVCTAGEYGRMCMSVASMSKLIMHSEGRQHYRCGNCAAEAWGEPASGSLPLRVLHLYALVGTGGSDPTPLHMRPVRLVLTAPPAQWAWGVDPLTDDLRDLDMDAVSPELGHDFAGSALALQRARQQSHLASCGPLSGCVRGVLNSLPISDRQALPAKERSEANV